MDVLFELFSMSYDNLYELVAV